MAVASSSTIECRWGILGCGPEAASFIAELQAGNFSSTTSIRHSIVGISSRSIISSQAFIDAHVHISSSSSKTIEAFGTSTELHAHPSIDSIFIASPQHSRYQEAVSALRGGKSILISKPLAISSTEARELCGLASKKENDKVKWLGFVMRPNAAKQTLLQAADECAKGRADEQSESAVLPWSESIAVLEALDEVREAGAMRLPSEEDGDDHYTSSPQFNGTRELKSRLSIDTAAAAAPRPSSRLALSSEAGQDEQATSASLRSQIQELRHILRQRNALITSLELKSSGGSSSTSRKAKIRKSLPPLASNSLHTPQSAAVLRRRTSSLDQDVPATPFSGDYSCDTSSMSGMPLFDVINTVDSNRCISPGSRSTADRRRRRSTNGGRTSSSPDKGNNMLGLTTVKEGNNLVLGEGFLAPTIASENRRIAITGSPSSAVTVLGSPISPGGGRGTSKFIESLTTELGSARAALDDAKLQLRSSQRTIQTLQRSMDETKETLGRSRLENERLGQMMTRKERQIQEALERARKAEMESKELGKSSREWGARVRKIEAELGEERVLKQRAEVQYDAISSSWKQVREAWEKEMKELRENQGDVVKRNRAQVQELQAKFKAAEESWKGREEEGKVLRGVIQQLEAERQRAALEVLKPVQELVAQLELQEMHTMSQDASVEAVQNELNRIVRLMREQ